ncbi:purine-cytosine permease-like protein [Streptomyces sp. TLI_55]|nr:purine-cytosine permease-like protein [Streptomyces sp. TLI_55]
MPPALPSADPREDGLLSRRTPPRRPAAPDKPLPRATTRSTAGPPRWSPLALAVPAARPLVRAVPDRGRDPRCRPHPRRGPHRHPAGPVPARLRRRQHLLHLCAGRLPDPVRPLLLAGPRGHRAGRRRRCADPVSDGGVRAGQRHHRLFGLPRGDLSYVVAYALFACLVLAVCVYGFRFMLFVNKVAVTSASVLFVVGAIAFAGDFDPSYAGVFTGSADAATQSLFWPSFIGAALIVLSNPVSFGAFLGDWSRYIPASTPRRRVVGAAFLSQIATLLPFLFGLGTASIIATKAPEYVDPAAPDFVGGLLAISPGWFFLPVCLLALIGGMSTGTTALYGTGLDFSSVFPRLSRVQATLLVGVASIAFIFIGRFGLNLVQSISTFATMIITCTTPWMVVMILGFWTRRGWYDPEALQVFNRRQCGGRYWFAHGWNWRGMTAWWVSALLGVLFTNIPGQFVGPLGDLANGVDISLPLSLVVSAVLFLTLLRVFPEPRAVYGPQGARLARTVDVPVPAITGPGAKAAEPAPVTVADGG